LFDAALDQVAALVGLAIVIDRFFSVRLRRDDRLDAALFEVVANRIGVVALVAEELLRLRFEKLDKCIVALDLMRLAAGQLEDERPAFGVGAQVDFGREATARSPKRLLI
jgi:hypothetical protein